MNNLQRSKLDANNRISDFNNAHQAELATISEYADEKQKFDTALNTIKKAGISQQHEGIDKSISLMAKKTMANIVTKYCLRAGVKARSLGNMELSNQLSVSVSEIFRTNKTKALQIAINKRNTLNDHLNILTNITADNIAEIDQAIHAYDSIKDAPTETKQTKKTTGTDLLSQAFNQADDAVNNMYELIVSYFSDTNSQLVNEFEIAKQVINTGIRHTSVTFTCLSDEDEKPIARFTVTDNSNHKTYLSDNEGQVNIIHHRFGHFHFTISAPLRIDVDFATDIIRGTQNNFTIRLKKSE
jgi:hypothetical protein